jgi:hypothetical protein
MECHARTSAASRIDSRGLIRSAASGRAEPPQILRRLQLLRRWSHEQVKEVLTRGPRARSAHGAGAPRGIPIAVGGRDTDATQPFGATPNSAVPGSKGTKCWCPRSSASGRPICRSTEPTRCAGGLKKGRPNGPTAKQPNSADHAGLDSHQPASTKPGCFTRRQGLLL